jgi:transposase
VHDLGVGRRAAEVIIAETGGDMTAFPSAKHLACCCSIAAERSSIASSR